MYCIRCGAWNGETNGNCVNCGAALVRPPLATNEPTATPPMPPSNYPYPPETGSVNQPPPALPSNYPYPPPPTAAPPYQLPSQVPPSASSSFPPPQMPPVYPYQPPANSGYSPPMPNYGYNPGGPFGNGSYAQPDLEAMAGYHHPLLTGAIGLPYPVMAQPGAYYSYLNEQGRVMLVRRASFWQRFVATLLDSLVLAIPVILLIVIYTASQSQVQLSALVRGANNSTPVWINLVAYLMWMTYYHFMTVGPGQTLGKRALNIKIIRLDGQKPDNLTSILRHVLGYPLSSAICLFGYIWASWDAQKQGWHDKLARTLVVESRILEEGRDFFLQRVT